MSSHSHRRVVLGRRAAGDVTIFATVPSRLRNASGRHMCVAADITPTGRVQPRPLTGSLDDGTRTPMAAAVAEAGPFESIEEYAAFCGHVMLDRLYLLMITKLEPAVTLPFGRSIFNIKATQWVGVPLAGIPPPKASRKDRQRLEQFLAWNIDAGHYICDEANLSTLFPHTAREPLEEHDPACCDWSAVMRQPYVDAGVGALTSALIRGFAKGMELTLRPPTAAAASPGGAAPASPNASSTSSRRIYMHMVGRQNRLNAGPRYFGRGLNERGQAGNDHIYELVVWRYVDPPPPADGSSAGRPTEIEFARHVYLRGTVPLRFVSKLSTSGIGEAEIKISGDVYDGAATYLCKQCTLVAGLQNEPAREPAGPIELRCLNLLRAVSSAGEDLLTHHFQSAVGQANDRLKASATTPPPEHTGPLPAAIAIDEDGEATPPSAGRAPHHIDMECVDWLGLQKDYGTNGACEVLWSRTLAFMDRSPCCFGRAVGARGTDGRPPPSDEWTYVAPDISVTIDRPQTRVLRINCADSLDRTNVAAFFVVAQLVPKMFTGLNIDPARADLPLCEVTSPTGASQSGSTASPRQSPAKPTVAPTGSDTPPLEPDVANSPAHPKPLSLPESDVPPCYHQTYDDFVACLPPSLMRALAEMFVANGDCVAQLYTSTGALHTSVMRKLAPGMKEAPNNSIISAQRRYENMFRDKRKRRVFETMLGVRLHEHFPSFQGTFGILPLPNELWARALVVLGLDASRVVLPETVTVALQAHWADIQQREGVEFATPQLSGELPVRLGIDPTTTVQHAGASGAASGSTAGHGGDRHSEQGAPDGESQVTGSAAAADPDEVLSEGAEVGTADRDGTATELMAVVVMPSDDICREILLRGAVPIRYADGSEGFVSVHPYGYAVETREHLLNPTTAGRVAAAASSLKRKFLRFVSS